MQPGEHEEAAQVEHLGHGEERGRKVGCHKSRVRAERVDVTAILALDGNDHRLRGAEPGDAAEVGDVDPGRVQLVADEVAEEVVADLRDDRRAHAEAGEGDRGVGGAATGLDDEVVGGHERADRAAARGAGRTRLRRRCRRRRPARGLPQPSATTVARPMSGSVKMSSSSRLSVENSETTAPPGPAWNQCLVPGGIVCWSPGSRTISCQTV